MGKLAKLSQLDRGAVWLDGRMEGMVRPTFPTHLMFRITSKILQIQ